MEAHRETRQLTFLLAEPERRLLRAMAARLPPWIRSNHLTGLGVAGALAAGAAYALSARHAAWLWAASAMLVVNWFGDSLDGTLARVRGVERPRYGYYLDHIVDAFNTAAVGIGIGLSPFVHLDVALILVVLYLTLSINVYLESAVFGVFRLAYGRLGPTEARIVLILGNTLLVAGPAVAGPLAGWLPVLANGAALVLVTVMLAVLSVRFGRNLHHLARIDPLGR
jgi:phosphatidylglycerophosphate synthase